MSSTVSEVCITKTAYVGQLSACVDLSRSFGFHWSKCVYFISSSRNFKKAYLLYIFCLYRMYLVNEEFHICDILTLIAWDLILTVVWDVILYSSVDK
jgi:hypothetical protein